MLEAQELRRRRRELIIIFSALLLVALITYLEIKLSGFSPDIPISNTILFFSLLNIDVLLILLIIFLIVRNLVKLIFERRSGIFGSKLKTKLVAAFVGLTLIPTTVLFLVAFVFINYQQKWWFDPKVEGIFDISKEIVQSRYEDDGEENQHFAKIVASHLNDFDLLDPESYLELQEYLEEKVAEYKLSQIELYSDRPGGLFFSTNPEFPVKKAYAPLEFVTTGLEGKEGYMIDVAEEFDVIRGVAPILSNKVPGKVIGAVVVNSFIDKSLFGQLKANKKAYNDFRSFKVFKTEFSSYYLIMLVVITLVVLLAAVWYGFYLAKGITGPIQMLATGTKAVAAGELDTVIEAPSHDEIGELVESFNVMTSDLNISKKALDLALLDLKDKNVELERRRQYMEIVLKNVEAGVVSLDADGRISTVNEAVKNMFNISVDEVIGKKYEEIIPEQYLGLFEELMAQVKHGNEPFVRRRVGISVRGESLVILITLTSLHDYEGKDRGAVVVFENLTELLRGQKAEAWREVARRIAHEIKNPLTPIQLSAQRLRKRYMAELSSNGDVFDECTNTIIMQVKELKTLVDEFSSFARLPAANPVPNDLNSIIREVVSLYQGAHNNISFNFIEEKRLPLFELDRDQIKRAFINLIDNAVDAIGREEGEIKIESMYNEQMEIARVEITDTGKGIRPMDMGRLFEPYFSTKEKGTGLGLVIVNRIIQDHYGYIRVKSNAPKGTQFTIELPTQLPYWALQDRAPKVSKPLLSAEDTSERTVAEET